jgi:hypothetical protein
MSPEVAWSLAIVAIVVLTVIGSSRRVRHPEQTAGHGDEPDDTRSDRFYRASDAAMGPDAEDPLPTDPRSPEPGPMDPQPPDGPSSASSDGDPTD